MDTGLLLRMQDMSMNNIVLPVEVKADTQGGMKSLWSFMRDRLLTFAIRCSLDNFGSFDYLDRYANAKGEALTAKRTVGICPLFAVSQLKIIPFDFAREKVHANEDVISAGR